ncbi:PREDICTED: molybdate transporter 2 [Tarenaya hassleriana]|uniref:molybdate transporter 2 n=1 Tax=Tarenaya hassleriana TaxID=28532 RepID=UPI00053CA26C|nr:PREDICTED: molybdate transporter 2 [Tarenaya hassleriana]
MNTCISAPQQKQTTCQIVTWLTHRVSEKPNFFLSVQLPRKIQSHTLSSTQIFFSRYITRFCENQSFTLEFDPIMDPTTTPLLPTGDEDGSRRCAWIRRRLRLKTPISSEISGAVGDLGTFIPIVLTLTLVSNLDLSTTLIFTALYNIATGLLFDIPMPVQPMKSIAAVAVSETPHLTTSQIAAAGASVAGVLLLLGVTGAMSFLYHLIPLPVVRGIQLSQGLQFAFTAVKYVRFNYDTATLKPSSVPRPWLGLDGLIVAFSALLFIILSTGSGDGAETDSEESNETTPVRRRLRTLSAIPSALIVFVVGLVFCFVRDPSIFGDLKFGPSKFKILKITLEDWKIGFLRGAIPQIPLSLLNSVIAVCKLSNDLFDKELSATTVSVSVGMMNLVGCWFGAMPVCHGAGGLAGQYRFGARSGLSVIILGLGKLIVGLVFGNSFVRILSQFPIGILGALLLFAGIELAMASRDMNSKEESFVMLVCAAVSMTGSSAALGFGCGLLLYLLLKLRTLDCSSFGRRAADSVA